MISMIASSLTTATPSSIDSIMRACVAMARSARTCSVVSEAISVIATICCSRADRTDADVEVTRVAVVEHRGVAVDLAGREHAMHRCERLRMQVAREEFGDGEPFQLLRAAPADAAVREQHAQPPVEHQHVVRNGRDQLAQRLARPRGRRRQVGGRGCGVRPPVSFVATLKGLGTGRGRIGHAAWCWRPRVGDISYSLNVARDAPVIVRTCDRVRPSESFRRNKVLAASRALRPSRGSGPAPPPRSETHWVA